MSVVTPAASVLLARGPGSREVFAILRARQLKFFGGFWAFPGGKLSLAESACEALADARRRAACRELFEETGILIARRKDGAFPVISDALTEGRRQLLAEQLSLEQLLAEHGLTIHAEDFQHIGEITTPAFAPIRFATTFYVSMLPPGQEPSVWPGELECGEWVEMSEMLARWRRGDALLTPPSVMSLEALGPHALDTAPRMLGPIFERLAAGAEHPIYFAPCVRMIPLQTVALPPSTHTNTFLVGNGPRYVIDPGPDSAAEQQRLFALLDEHARAGEVFTAILLTHHHPDHIGAANACSQRYGLPIWAHDATAKRLEGRVRIDRRLTEGDQLDLGPCPADGGRWWLDVLHTPGHASGHLVFFEPRYRLLFAGDMVSTLTSIVITPPDGNLRQYLDSLRRLRDLPTRMVLPAHGNVTTRAEQLFDDALEHRARREKQLLEALAAGPAMVNDLTTRLYRGTPEPLMRFAQSQVLAGLLKLQAEGLASRVDEECWRLG